MFPGKGLTELVFNRAYFEQHGEMCDWADKHFGPGGWQPHEGQQWHSTVVYGCLIFCFQCPSDATAFELRWRDSRLEK